MSAAAAKLSSNQHAGRGNWARPDVVPMRASQTIAVRCFVASLISLCWVMVFWVVVLVLGFGPDASQAADDVRQPIAIQFSLDRPIDAGAAPFVMASARGLFGAEGLAVAINVASGSADAIARVASGASDFALADINELIRYRDGPRAAPVKAVFVLFNKSPYAIVARKSRGISRAVRYRRQDRGRRRQ
jgi:NitT/TauT family transport system substrate-binding protein